MYKNRIINIHPALIPSFCGDGFYGLKVHEAALEKGVKVTGATVHFVNEETDAGPIILQKAVYIEDDDTPEILQNRLNGKYSRRLLNLYPKEKLRWKATKLGGFCNEGFGSRQRRKGTRHCMEA